jgi:hypothetical protein
MHSSIYVDEIKQSLLAFRKAQHAFGRAVTSSNSPATDTSTGCEYTCRPETCQPTVVGDKYQYFLTSQAQTLSSPTYIATASLCEHQPPVVHCLQVLEAV